MKHSVLILLFIILSFLIKISGNVRDTIDLSGEWSYRLIGAPSSIPGEGVINLPNTLDFAHKSIYHPESDNTTQLRQEYSFSGKAEYINQVLIPDSWKGKNIELFLERTKPSVVKIDGEIVGNNSRISSPQKYNLTEFLSPGKHLIEISVDNADSIPPMIARNSNAASIATQTNWNGILGDFFLEAKNYFNISNVKINDTQNEDNIIITVKFSCPAPEKMQLTVKLNNRNTTTENIIKGAEGLDIRIPKKNLILWSSQKPVLNSILFSIKNREGLVIDKYDLITGFRDFSTSDKTFLINNHPVFLRGAINAAIFPLTGYAPTDKESWVNYYKILKNYGINHVRFHSWTPPDAAFKAADEEGIFILTELPIWGELDNDLKFHNRFLREELKGIMATYGHHPSFVMFSPGNELWGDISLMGEYMKDAKELNPRILSTYGTNVYFGMNGEIGGEDFIISAKTSDDPNSYIRGSMSFADSSSGGFFNSVYPNNSINFSNNTKKINTPIITHEAGQYQSYPDFEEINKYSGILKPDNLKEFKKRAIEAGTYRKSQAYKNASGKLAAKLYKAEIELALRSNGISGIELFGLQDYTGQGTALIGLLDPFMDSKGYISEEDFKYSSSDITLLAEFPKFTFYDNENVKIPVVGVDFSENKENLGLINWSTEFTKGQIDIPNEKGVFKAGTIEFKTPKVKVPKEMNLKFISQDHTIINNYNFWVYPATIPSVKGVKTTDNLTEALILLDQGENVILCPDTATVKNASLEPLYIPDFWNYRMYRSICDEMNLTPSPGTLGLLVNNLHPALQYFPSEINSDWQWWIIVKNSKPLIIDRLPKDFDPIVEVIDNVERNFRLSLILECKVGKGKLIILSANQKEIEKYPEGKWLLYSLEQYISSKDCKPQFTLIPEQVVNLVTKPSTARFIKELKNETYNSKWE